MFAPCFSAVVVVRDRSGELDRCLKSLLSQENAPPFEVVVVDDGSVSPIAEELDDSVLERIVLARQIPLGIAAARNRGIAQARGANIVFLDSDCRAAPGMLMELAACIDDHPEDVAFQLRLSGAGDSLVGRLEEFRLAGIQESTRTADGHVAYLNTSGFCVRRSFAEEHAPLFDPGLVRGEDTALLARLVERGSPPRLVDDAVIEHCPGIGAVRYVLKHFRIGYHSGQARRALARARHRFLSASARVGMFRSIAARARSERRGTARLVVLLACYGFERLGRVCHALCGIVPARQRILTAVVDPLRQSELVSKLLDAADERRPVRVTYLTAWSLVQSVRDPAFAGVLSRFDLVYADGMGVVLALLLTRLRRCKKITAGDYFLPLCEELARRGRSVALIGASSRTNQECVARLRAHLPDLHIGYHRSGYVAPDEREEVLRDVLAARPDLVVLGMGQPLQERWAFMLQDRLDAPVLCVGGLFELLSGEVRPPRRWIRRLGFEWAHRLATQPRRFWRRYLVGLPVLAALMLADPLRRVAARAHVGARRSTL